MQFSGNGRRFALFVYGSADPLSGRWFSNTRRATPIVAHEIGAVIAFVVELDPGEDPFGLQVVDEDGAVVSAVSFVS
jgi:hypothetical protein